MSTCNAPTNLFQAESSKLDVSEKYIQLMTDSLSEDSLYIRAKDTLKVIFDDIQITEKEKAELVLSYITQFSTSISSVAMQTAVTWTKEERDGAYTLAKSKADTELLYAQTAKAQEEICLAQKQVEKTCAEITAVISSTYRENGKPTGYEEGGCKPTGLDDTGLKYAQTGQVNAVAYQTFADAYRKSGVVHIGTDTSDNETKGLSGDADGYTWQQSQNAERQRIGYEDSKRSHAANSAASMIGQLLSSETLSTNNAQDIDRWRESIDFLNTSHSSTSNT